MKPLIPERFFLFWSGQDFQLVHLLCVHSILRTHPDAEIRVAFLEEPKKNPYWNGLKGCQNVSVSFLDFEILFKLSGLHLDYPSSFIRSAAVNHLSDLFRMLSLYCYGGIYSDFDCLVMKSLRPFFRHSFFAGVQPSPHGDVVNGAVMGSGGRDPFLKSLIQKAVELIHKDQITYWGSLGPILLSDHLRSNSLFNRCRFFFNALLSNPNMKKLRLLLDAGFNRAQRYHNPDRFIATESCFYSYSYLEWQEIFKKNELSNEAYSLHLWSYHSRKFTEKIDIPFILTSNCLYAEKVRNLFGSQLADLSVHFAERDAVNPLVTSIL